MSKEELDYKSMDIDLNDPRSIIRSNLRPVDKKISLLVYEHRLKKQIKEINDELNNPWKGINSSFWVIVSILAIINYYILLILIIYLLFYFITNIFNLQDRGKTDRDLYSELKELRKKEQLTSDYIEVINKSLQEYHNHKQNIKTRY